MYYAGSLMLIFASEINFNNKNISISIRKISAKTAHKYASN